MTHIMKIRLLALSVLALYGFTSCSDWTSTESVEVDSVYPWEREPELWEEYRAAIRDYKNRDHYLVYARFENSPEGAMNEKGSMRCLPDSLDIVSLTNAANFSEYDAEDMSWMHGMGTKVLYQLDFAGSMMHRSCQPRWTRPYPLFPPMASTASRSPAFRRMTAALHPACPPMLSRDSHLPPGMTAFWSSRGTLPSSHLKTSAR